MLEPTINTIQALDAICKADEKELLRLNQINASLK